MIVRLRGVIEEVASSGVVVANADASLARLVLATAHDLLGLERRVGETVTFHTLEYQEASAQGGHTTPRLVGFVREPDRRFFELLTSVKGIGPRKALRAMAEPTPTIAGAIAARDVKLLTRLPEIGKRTAEAMVAELHDRVSDFAVAASVAAAAVEARPISSAAEQAIGAMVALGETRADAEALVRRAVESDPSLGSADALLAAAFAVRS